VCWCLLFELKLRLLVTLPLRQGEQVSATSQQFS
jgi:hypothetical protein